MKERKKVSESPPENKLHEKVGYIVYSSTLEAVAEKTVKINIVTMFWLNSKAMLSDARRPGNIDMRKI